MSFLFHNNKNFTLIDSTPKSGVFCQFFTVNSAPKLLTLQHQHTVHYSAFLDPHQKPHVVIMPDHYHINYFTIDNHRMNKASLINSSTENYRLSYPMLYTLEQMTSLIYLSHQVDSKNYSFVHQNVQTQHLTTLLTIDSEPELIKYFSSANALYIFYVIKNQYYTLNYLRITATEATQTAYLHTPNPIIDYSVCLQGNSVHSVFVTEVHGKYQLSYLNNVTNQIALVTTSTTPLAPVIFYYYNALFINAIIDKKLHMLLTMDQGSSFSLPVPCSIQNNIRRYNFSTTHQGSLAANELYASLGVTLKLCTLAMIDFEALHTDTYISPELELLLEGLLLFSNTPHTSLVNKENEQLKQELAKLKRQLSSSSTNSPKNIDSAKTAFMDELSSWDLPPRV